MTDRIELTDEAKLFVVQALACFDTPTAVAKAVNEAFALPMSRQAVERYDPTKPAGAALSAELRTAFEATRARFVSETAAIGVSHRVVRLRRIQRLADRAEDMGNIAMAAKLLEQAAREMGGTFTNARRATPARSTSGSATSSSPASPSCTPSPCGTATCKASSAGSGAKPRAGG